LPAVGGFLLPDSASSSESRPNELTAINFCENSDAWHAFPATLPAKHHATHADPARPGSRQAGKLSLLLAPRLGCGYGAGRGKTAGPCSRRVTWIEIGFESRESARARLGRRFGSGAFIACLTAGPGCLYRPDRSGSSRPCSLRIGGIEICFKFKLSLSHNVSVLYFA